jgi:hypothetical protein
VNWLRSSFLRAGLAAWLAGCAFPPPAAAQTAIHLSEHERIVLEIRVLTAETVEEPEGGFALEVEEASPAELDLRVLWPDPRVPRRLKLRAERALTAAGHVVRLASELQRGDGTVTARAKRDITFFSETTTALFEVARVGDRVLTLAVAGELTRETTYTARPVVGTPVQFQLDIEWVEQGSAVTLETNHLSTFVGQSVSYSFRLGEIGEAESASVRLLPARILGDTVRIEVDVTGTLPDPEGGVVMVSRQEQWLSTRGTTSTLSLASGEPPTGFRFVVTPRF